MAAGVGTLWHGIYKINSESRSFNFKVHFAEIDEAAARDRADKIGKYLKYLMPTSCEMFFASVNKDNTAPDSRFIAGAVGPGLYGTLATPAVETDVDASQTALKIRFEHSEGGVLTRKLCPLPDTVVTGDKLTTPVVGIVAPVVGAIPAPGAGADWFAELTNFLKYLCVNTHHVKGGHAPGGNYTYFNWAAIIPTKIGKKKGGSVLTS